MSRNNNDYTIASLLDFSNYQNYYKLVGIDLSRKEMRVFLNKLVLQEN